MKKYLLIMLALLVVASGCSLGSKGKYKDGVYLGFSDSDENGYIKAEVTLKEDKIVAVKLAGFDGLGLEKEPTYPWLPYHLMLEKLPDEYVKKNSWNVDAISQATGSSNQANLASQRALALAETKPAKKSKFFDGTFMGISSANEKGWTVAWVTLKNDKITEVVLRGVAPVKDQEGKFAYKDACYPWPQYHEALEILPLRFIKANGPKIEILSGATGTSQEAKEAVQEALKFATR